MVSASAGISMLNTATAIFALMAAFSAHVHGEGGLAHGRAAGNDDQVPGCRPEVLSSRSVKPVGTPVMGLSLS